MTDIWAALESDVADIIGADGVSVSVTTDAGTVAVTVFWQDSSIEGGAMGGPGFYVAEEDLPADFAQGSTVTKAAVVYRVEGIQPDGHGLTAVVVTP